MIGLFKSLNHVTFNAYEAAVSWISKVLLVTADG
jgi:hypothetical protein